MTASSAKTEATALAASASDALGDPTLATRMETLDRVAARRTRAAVGGFVLLLGIFMLRPSFLMFFFLLFGLVLMQSIPDAKVALAITGGLPYKKYGPCALARKPWWQILLFPLEANVRSLWTGVVSKRPNPATGALQMIGRVRALLVEETWYLQTPANAEQGWRVDVRAPLNSPLWRTCYTAAAVGNTLVPPPTAPGMWRLALPPSSVSEPLKMELPMDAAKKNLLGSSADGADAQQLEFKGAKKGSKAHGGAKVKTR